jgi:tripartite-type tricarboxylate transporter receptor subunit TctC
MNLPIYRICMQGLVLAGLLLGASSAAGAQSYPNRPITIKVAFPAGGPADVSIRAANIVLQRHLGPSPLVGVVRAARHTE